MINDDDDVKEDEDDDVKDDGDDDLINASHQ